MHLAPYTCLLSLSIGRPWYTDNMALTKSYAVFPTIISYLGDPVVIISILLQLVAIFILIKNNENHLPKIKYLFYISYLILTLSVLMSLNASMYYGETEEHPILIHRTFASPLYILPKAFFFPVLTTTIYCSIALFLTKRKRF